MTSRFKIKNITLNTTNNSENTKSFLNSKFKSLKKLLANSKSMRII